MDWFGKNVVESNILEYKQTLADWVTAGLSKNNYWRGTLNFILIPKVQYIYEANVEFSAHEHLTAFGARTFILF
jgi:hypothetical protein